MALSTGVSFMNEPTILVFGGGPAGAAVAIGLVRLGYRVTVIAKPRPFDAVEGISDRVVEGLRGAGFSLALNEIAEPSPRHATWGGQTVAANTEHLIWRNRFDKALLLDLKRHGAEVIEGRVRNHARYGSQYTVAVELEIGNTTNLPGDFIVDARGRAAPSAHVTRRKGPQTVSLLQPWQGPTIHPCSAVESFADGWAWMATQSDGRRYLQLTLDATSSRLPARKHLNQWFKQELGSLQKASPFIEGAEPIGEPYGRTSTAVLCKSNIEDNWIRVGDAAMAVDPLSGNGMFQALSSALQAPAVINTILQYPERAELAKQFYEARIETLFYRFARIGRDFYHSETQWSERSFWQSRRKWPDDEPVHAGVTPDEVVTAHRPVVNDGFIEEKEVVITPDFPLGIWHLNGVPLAILLDTVRAEPHRSPSSVLAETLGHEKGKLMALWMEKQGWIEGTANVS